MAVTVQNHSSPPSITSTEVPRPAVPVPAGLASAPTQMESLAPPPKKREYPDIGYIEMGLTAIKDLIVWIFSKIFFCFRKKVPPPQEVSQPPQQQPSLPPADPLVARAQPDLPPLEPPPAPSLLPPSALLQRAPLFVDPPPSPAPSSVSPPSPLHMSSAVDEEREILQEDLDQVDRASDQALIALFEKYYSTYLQKKNLYIQIGTKIWSKYVWTSYESRGQYEVAKNPKVLAFYLKEKIAELLNQ